MILFSFFRDRALTRRVRRCSGRSTGTTCPRSSSRTSTARMSVTICGLSPVPSGRERAMTAAVAARLSPEGWGEPPGRRCASFSPFSRIPSITRSRVRLRSTTGDGVRELLVGSEDFEARTHTYPHLPTPTPVPTPTHSTPAASHVSLNAESSSAPTSFHLCLLLQVRALRDDEVLWEVAEADRVAALAHVQARKSIRGLIAGQTDGRTDRRTDALGRRSVFSPAVVAGPTTFGLRQGLCLFSSQTMPLRPRPAALATPCPTAPSAPTMAQPASGASRANTRRESHQFVSPARQGHACVLSFVR